MLCVRNRKLTLMVILLSRRKTPASLVRSWSPCVTVLFTRLVSLGTTTLFRSAICAIVIDSLVMRQDDRISEPIDTFEYVESDSPPLSFHATVWWVQHPLSETVCRCNPWSIRAGNVPSRDRCWPLEQSFSCPGSAPIWPQVEVCWVGTWKTQEANRGTDNRSLMSPLCPIWGAPETQKPCFEHPELLLHGPWEGSLPNK